MMEQRKIEDKDARPGDVSLYSDKPGAAVGCVLANGRVYVYKDAGTWLFSASSWFSLVDRLTGALNLLEPA